MRCAARRCWRARTRSSRRAAARRRSRRSRPAIGSAFPGSTSRLRSTSDMASIIGRRTIVCALGAAPFAASRLASAEGKAGSAVYPVAVPGYQVMFVAEAKGFLKDEGYDFKLIQGGSGTKTRAIMAAGEADFMI